MATAAPDRCPSCGAERPAGAPLGLCPRCLLRGGLDSGLMSLSDAGELGATVDLSGSPSVLERLDATVGPVPRVLLRDPENVPEPPLHRPASPEVPDAADRPPRLRLLGEISRGGMGAVLKGRDEDLGRDLAVKVLLEKHRDDPDLIRRFVEEAQIGGQLQHPGIVPIYELGSFGDRRPYFAMKLVKGRTLAELLAGRPSPLDGLARFLGIFEQICQTVAYAHARGVIHRDLKPSNVMVGSFGEVQVMDWGLAKVLDRGGVADDRSAGLLDDAETLISTARSGSDSDLSHAGSVLGTPAYMAPEQARGEIDAIDERADVFALGSILCEILTGSPAFTGRSSAEIQRKAARADTADALSRLDSCGADAELIALCRSCLSPDPDARPRDARAVADRLTSHLSGVQERLRTAELERARAEARALEERKRRKLQLGLAASILALSTLGGLTFTYALHERQAEAARVDRLLAEVTLLRDQALAQPDDVARWERARDALARLAVDFGTSAPAALGALHQQIESGLEAAEADRALLDQLIDIRSAQADDPDGSASDAAYAAAFAAAGINVDDLGFETAGVRIRSRSGPVALALVAALDDWASRRRLANPSDAVAWRRLVAAARAADPDPRRDELRRLWEQPDLKAQLDPLRTLAEVADVEAWPVQTLNLLAAAVDEAGDVDAAVALLRRAVARHPGDVWINFGLAGLLERTDPLQLDEAIRYYTAARALRPETAHDFARFLTARGRTDEAIVILRDLVRLRPDEGRHLSRLGRTLLDQGQREAGREMLEAAVKAFRETIRLNPNLAETHHQLGLALFALMRHDEAVAEVREAIRLRPDTSVYHFHLGDLLLVGQNKPDEAIVAFREAIRLQPERPWAYIGLGNALKHKGRYDEAIEQYRGAIRINPNASWAQDNLGQALFSQGRHDEAIAAFREAIRLRPDYASAYYSLGNVLSGRGRLEEAIATYGEAIRLKPDHAEAHCNLGSVLRRTGDYAGSLDEYRKGHELGSKRPGWPYPSADWVALAEQWAALAERLSAVLSGEDKPADDAERLALAQMCYDTKRFAAAARFWGEAIEADPTLANDLRAGHRYNAACAATLAGGGEGQDDPPPDDAGRAALRQQALAWLRADLALRTEQLESINAADARRALLHWQADPDFAGVREPDALAALPEDERAEWQALWDEVGRLLEDASGSP